MPRKFLAIRYYGSGSQMVRSIQIYLDYLYYFQKIL